MDKIKTVNDAFLLVTGRGEQVGWKSMDVGGGTPDGAAPSNPDPAPSRSGPAWRDITSAEMYGQVRAMAEALAAWGVGKGDRVALISENRWEWPVIDFAVLALAAVDVPLYLTLTAEQIGYMLRDSGAKVAVVSNWEQAEKIRAAGELPALEHLVVMDEPTANLGAPHLAEMWEQDRRKTSITQMSSLLKDAPAMQARDAAFDARARAIQPEDLATIIYTSGTTGEPK